MVSGLIYVRFTTSQYIKIDNQVSDDVGDNSSLEYLNFNRIIANYF